MFRPEADRTNTGKLLLLMAVTLAVCPVAAWAQFAPSDAGNYAAKVVTVSGQVSVLKDSVPWALSVGDAVQVQQVIVTGPEGHALFQVSDGSTFEVYPGSTVVFRKTPFNWRDLIDVLVGKVRVHIEHLGGQPNPNRVLTPTAVISVRGTTFDVSVDDDDETTVVEVEDGEVIVQHALIPGDPKVLHPGDVFRVYKNEPLASNGIDKGAILQQALRMLRNVGATLATRSAKPVGTGSGQGCRPGLPGCPGAPPPPTAPPPPPPPPPPLH